MKGKTEPEHRKNRGVCERERDRESIPAVGDGDDAGAILSNLEEHGHGEVKMRAGRVTPAAIVTWECIIGRAKVCSGNQNGRAPGVTPRGFVCTLDLKASTAAQAIVEQRRAQGRRVHAVALAVQVTVTARSSCSKYIVRTYNVKNA